MARPARPTDRVQSSWRRASFPLLVGGLLVGGLLLTPPGCTAPPPRKAPPPELLTTPDAIQGDVLLRQRVEGEFHGERTSFEAALQKKGDTLTVIGLTPFGTKAFVLVQQGDDVRFTSYLPPDRELPLDPAYLLQDIHHAFLLSAAPDPHQVLEDGDHELELVVPGGGEHLEERWAEGRVMSRTYRKRAAPPEGEVVVTYEGGMQGRLPPRVTRLDNGYYGYRLTIETLEARYLE